MKIGILTFHRAYNYGAFLQCYSLQEELKKRFPNANIEIIDYESANMASYYHTNVWNYFFGPKNTISNYSLPHRMKHFASRIYGIMKGKSGIKAYYSNRRIKPLFDKSMNKLDLSKEKLVSDSYDEVLNFIQNQHYDVIVVGSDAVWNDTQTNIPSVFYLSESLNSTKLSYAASCYGFDYNRRGVQNDIRKIRAIQSFSYLGVRDTETEQYIKYLDNSLMPTHNCDPTLLLNLDSLDIDEEALKEKIIKHGISFEKPIVGVMGNSQIGKVARDVCGQDVQIVAVYYNNEYCDAALLDLSPMEWACVFRFFQVTFTSFFHGTIFSLKNGTPTITIEQNLSYAEQHITKTRDLLDRLKLKYYVSEENQNMEYYKELYKTITENSQKHLIKEGIECEMIYAETFFEKLNSIILKKDI